MENRAVDLLKEFGRDIRWPFYKNNISAKRNQVVGQNYSFEIIAVNFLPGLMKVPVDVGKQQAKWFTPEYSEYLYNGKVYSLKVQPWHYYIANKIVVHNCIYLFPDISYQGYKELTDGKNIAQKKDEIYRLFYVGMTRAKEKLIILAPTRQRGGWYFIDL